MGTNLDSKQEAELRETLHTLFFLELQLDPIAYLEAINPLIPKLSALVMQVDTSSKKESPLQFQDKMTGRECHFTATKWYQFHQDTQQICPYVAKETLPHYPIRFTRTGHQDIVAVLDQHNEAAALLLQAFSVLTESESLTLAVSRFGAGPKAHLKPFGQRHQLGSPTAKIYSEGNGMHTFTLSIYSSVSVLEIPVFCFEEAVTNRYLKLSGIEKYIDFLIPFIIQEKVGMVNWTFYSVAPEENPTDALRYEVAQWAAPF